MQSSQGEEVGLAYDRQKIMQFIKVTRDYSHLKPEGMEIIAGALRLKKTTAGQVMTRLQSLAERNSMF